MAEPSADCAPLKPRVSQRLTSLLDAIVMAAVVFGSTTGAAAWALSSSVDREDPGASA
jgi:hypothetical protein